MKKNDEKTIFEEKQYFRPGRFQAETFTNTKEIQGLYQAIRRVSGEEFQAFQITQSIKYSPEITF